MEGVGVGRVSVFLGATYSSLWLKVPQVKEYPIPYTL